MPRTARQCGPLRTCTRIATKHEFRLTLAVFLQSSQTRFTIAVTPKTRRSETISSGNRHAALFFGRWRCFRLGPFRCTSGCARVCDPADPDLGPLVSLEDATRNIVFMTELRVLSPWLSCDRNSANFHILLTTRIRMSPSMRHSQDRRITVLTCAGYWVHPPAL